MTQVRPTRQSFNILAVGQSGRLQYEAVLLAASLRAFDPGFAGTLYIAEPQPSARWPEDPRIKAGPVRDLLVELGRGFPAVRKPGLRAELSLWQQDRGAGGAAGSAPFCVLDTDTLVTGSFSR